MRDCLDDMHEFSDGSVALDSSGFLGEDEDVVRTTFGPAYERLAEVKGEYDPTTVPGEPERPADGLTG